MKHISLVGAAVVALLLQGVLASRLVSEIVSFYERILRSEPFYKDKVDVDGLMILLSLFDDDSRCFAACEAYLYSIVGEGIPFTYLNVLVDKIYGDQISDDPFQPQEIHLALTSDKSSMKVQWVTMDNLEKPFAQYKHEQESDWKAAKIASAVNYTYEVEQKWWPIFTGVIYETDMTDLVEGRRYSYRVGGWDSVNKTVRYSDEFSFKAPPQSVNPNRKTVVTTLADHGTFMLFGFLTIDKLVKLLADEQTANDMDFVFVAGDLSYAGLSSEFKPLNITSEDEFEHIWDLLFIQNQPVAAKYPWMVGDGNHERFYNWSAFTNRYKMPVNEELGSVGNFWYDFDYGNIHWISISSEHSLEDGSDQKVFLEKSLQAGVQNREAVPWIIVTLHKPLYCSSSDWGTDGISGYQVFLEDMLIKYDVDLTITGHMHLYERIHPVLDGVVTNYPINDHPRLFPDIYYSTGYGPVHVVQGNTGAMQVESWMHPQPTWSAVRFANGYIPRNESIRGATTVDGRSWSDLPMNYTNTFGYGIITAWNATHLHYAAQADTESSLGTDSFWIVKRI